MNIGKITKFGLKLLGGIGAAAWSGLGIYTLGALMKDTWRERKSRQWAEGYDTAMKQANAEINDLKRRNDELLQKAMKMSEAAE